MFELIGIAIGGVVAVFGYMTARRFVRERLRYVDASRKRSAPLVAAAITAAVAWPITWIVPLIGGGTALLLGAAVGVGVAQGARDIRQIGSGQSGP